MPKKTTYHPERYPYIRGIEEEEAYFETRTTKADRRAGTAGGGSGRAGAVNRGARRREATDRKRRDSAKKSKRGVNRRKEKREEEREAQLEARRAKGRAEAEGYHYWDYWDRKLNPPDDGPLDSGHEGNGSTAGVDRKNVGGKRSTGVVVRNRGNGSTAGANRKSVGSRRSTGIMARNRGGRRQHFTAGGQAVQILSAEELGIESRADYDRLLRILQGDNITPEDYEVLLQLDKKNTKSTMDATEVTDLELLVVGAARAERRQKNRTVISKDELGSGSCLICLKPYCGLEDGAELRRLPCQHVYCRGCIDQWLTESSDKCPDLSCFWRKPKDSI